jgi:hypothetical protein
LRVVPSIDKTLASIQVGPSTPVSHRRLAESQHVIKVIVIVLIGGVLISRLPCRFVDGCVQSRWPNNGHSGLLPNSGCSGLPGGDGVLSPWPDGVRRGSPDSGGGMHLRQSRRTGRVPHEQYNRIKAHHLQMAALAFEGLLPVKRVSAPLSFPLGLEGEQIVGVLGVAHPVPRFHGGAMEARVRPAGVQRPAPSHYCLPRGGMPGPFCFPRRRSRKCIEGFHNDGPMRLPRTARLFHGPG